MKSEKILYFECTNGISGDMALGALIHLGADAKHIAEEIEKLNPGEFKLIPNESSKNGIGGINLEVVIPHNKDHIHPEFNIKAFHHAEDVLGAESTEDKNLPYNIKAFHHAEDVLDAKSTEEKNVPFNVKAYHHAEDVLSPALINSTKSSHHQHTSYIQIKNMIERSELNENVKEMALSIFRTIGIAEAAVHQKSLEEVTFHEVGAVDSIVDIIGTAIAIDMLDVDKIYCSPVHDGQGKIECRHGIIPVPVPAVMEMLKNSDIPIVIDSDVTTEMVTPTGFGILEGLHAEVKPVIGIIPEKVGYGFGKRDTGRFNAIRIIIGEEYIDGEEFR